jgi:curved DNA-binding protein CbpA
VKETITIGIALVDGGADHYTLLGLKRDASLEAIREAYLGFASQLHKNKLPPFDDETQRQAQRLFSQINLAFGVLSDPLRRAAYDATPAEKKLADGSGVRDDSNRADQEYQRGLRALKREDLYEAVDALTAATTLAPQDVDYAAMLAWARFCASSDKEGIAVGTRKVLERAISRSQNPLVARFYLGRIERMLGRLPQALHHFRIIVDEEPQHADAAAEIRMLEQRVNSAARR